VIPLLVLTSGEEVDIVGERELKIVGVPDGDLDVDGDFDSDPEPDLLTLREGVIEETDNDLGFETDIISDCGLTDVDRSTLDDDFVPLNIEDTAYGILRDPLLLADDATAPPRSA
jgi:hypothetical protein